ncbi:hypothetical protein AVEN_119865-1 [Araneus ventricosus]|uniref:Peptidase aspartic putative domain-containing protein n=1 Tax=Araneus ventricosus TaxID=182803 RepID=A0A4Y2RF99_ARAVE|nr:hypothetical protein AVEN_119865-1 [Araneus ventricosus]
MSLTTNELPNWDKFIEFLRKRSQVLENINGTHQQIRVKITNHGKNKNFMLKSTSKNICVLGKGGHAIYNCSAFLEMTPLQRFDINLLIVPKITDFVPSKVLNIAQLNIPKRSELADPNFDKLGKIDMLLGAELFYKIIKDGKIRLSSKLLFQNSVFGYIASGIVALNNSEQFCGLISQREIIENTLQKFWEIEDLSSEHQLNKEAEICENHFQKTHCRDKNGRYIVQMPLIEEDSTIETLGMAWKSNEDQFIFTVSVKEQIVYTKRDVLSTIAKFFDPLGLLGPVICKAKIFLQRLWYILNSQPERIVLLGFSDASTHAYGAVVYLQCHAKDSTPLSKLLASKSRVAPLKTISVPRLELCACLLLAKLVEKVLLSLKMNIEEVILFSDSNIVLAWINSPSHQLKTFVGNKVFKIQSLTEHHQWRHISSTENPADIISRGADPTDLKNLNLWWTGPTIFIEETNNDFSSSEIKMDSFERELYSAEHKQLHTNNLVLSTDNDFITQILSLSNNFQKLIRILSFLFRFLYNCKTKEKKSGSISVEEFQHAKKYLAKTIQVNVFSAEINALKKNESIKRTNVSNLNVFLDDDDLIRVGGRLTNSELSFDQKHPILLPRDHKLTDIIMEHFHIKNLHVGAQTLLHLVRQEYWPLNGRNNARRIVHANALNVIKLNPNLKSK